MPDIRRSFTQYLAFMVAGFDAQFAAAQVIYMLPPAVGDLSSAQAVSEGGLVVGYSTDGGDDIATVWHLEAGSYVAESLPTISGAPFGAANSINSSDVIGGYAQPPSGDTAAAMIWNGSPGAYSVSTLPAPAGSTLTDAYSIGAGGDVGGFALDSLGASFAVVWPAHSGGSHPVVAALPAITGAVQSAATAVNGAGDLAGYTIDARNRISGAVWVRTSGAEYTAKTVIAADSALISAISDSGFGAGVYAGREPLVMALFDADYYATSLPMSFGATQGASDSINNLDVLVGFVKDPTTPAAGAEAAIWLPTDTFWDYLNLDVWLDQVDPLAGGQWTLIEATSISDNSLIAGRGMYDPDGPLGAMPAIERGFLLDASSLVPEPSAAAIACAALLLAAGGRRRSM